MKQNTTDIFLLLLAQGCAFIACSGLLAVLVVWFANKFVI